VERDGAIFDYSIALNYQSERCSIAHLPTMFFATKIDFIVPLYYVSIFIVQLLEIVSYSIAFENHFQQGSSVDATFFSFDCREVLLDIV
jgi:hypothetical protein